MLYFKHGEQKKLELKPFSFAGMSERSFERQNDFTGDSPS